MDGKWESLVGGVFRYRETIVCQFETKQKKSHRINTYAT